MKYTNRFTRNLLTTAVAIALPGAAMAQLEEVVVTATKRAASVQDIPMSVEAVTGEALNQQGISDFEDLSSTIPNFSVGQGMWKKKTFFCFIITEKALRRKEFGEFGYSIILRIGHSIKMLNFQKNMDSKEDQKILILNQ